MMGWMRVGCGVKLLFSDWVEGETIGGGGRDFIGYDTVHFFVLSLARRDNGR